jgi:mannonate dehydratase
MSDLKITAVQVFLTQPATQRLIVVKVTTSEPGLYGLGCATFTQRHRAVQAAVEHHIGPFAVGKDPRNIEDFWQSAMVNGYWRNGPVLNNAISGVDEALWDIKGRQAGMPVYQVLGGKCREAAATFANAGGADVKATVEGVRQAMARGYRHVRVSAGARGGGGTGGGAPAGGAKALHDRPVFERGPALRKMLETFEAVRKEVGFEVELMHDMHERYEPREAIQFFKDCEQFKLYFLEDPFSPEDLPWFRQLRAQSSTPIAMGELFNSPHEWTPLMAERLIDYIRVHVSQAGGLTPCRKMAALAELFGVRTAWHGPGDVSPVGHACNIALDLACYNFGVQESTVFNDATREVFQGCPELKNGYFYASEAPGWGIEVDERAAKKYPFGHGETGERQRLNGGWGEIRRRDGTIIKQ